VRAETRPRKRAKQDRSRGTVEAILAAAARVLVDVGYDRASTKRIAAEAALSIGSLYQYFPTKEAVVAELMDRHITTVWRALQAEIARYVAADLDTAVRGIVRAFFHAQSVDIRLRRVFIEQVPRVGRLDRMTEIEEHAVDLARAYFATRPAEIAGPNLDLAARVVVRAIAHLTYDALVRPAGKDEEMWIDEIAKLAFAYLRSRS
jgi:AcrR family transcriptional regulator